MGNIYNSKERDTFDFMYDNARLNWYEGGYEQFVNDFSENNKKAPYDTFDYWNARNEKVSQAIASFKGRVPLSSGAASDFAKRIESAINFKSYGNTLSDYELTRPSMLKLNEVIHGNGELMVFDTETLGDTARTKPGGGVAITEIGYAIKGNGKETYKTAVYGIDDEQYDSLLKVYEKYRDEGYNALNGTEQSTIERLSRYRGITNKITYDQSLKSYVIKQGEVLADSDIYNPGSILEGLNDLHTLGVGGKGSPYYSGRAGIETGMNEMIKLIDARMQNPDTPVMAKNKTFDINAIENTAIRSKADGGSIIGFTGGASNAIKNTVDIQTMTHAAAIHHDYTMGHMNAEAAGGRLYSKGGNTLTTYFEIENGAYKEFPAHVAGEDSLITAQFAFFESYDDEYFRRTGMKANLIELAERAYNNSINYKPGNEKFPKGLINSTHYTLNDLVENGIYLKSGAYDRRNDFYTILGEGGQEEMLKGFSGANQFWKLEDYNFVSLDPISLTARKDKEFTKEVVPERKGVMLKLRNTAREEIALYKFFDIEDKNMEWAINKAGTWLYYNADVLETPVSKEYAKQQYDMAIRDAARRDIAKVFSTEDATVNYKTTSNGLKIRDRYNTETTRLPNYLLNGTLTEGTYKYSGGYADAEKYYYTIKQITENTDKILINRNHEGGMDGYRLLKRGEKLPDNLGSNIEVVNSKGNENIVARAIHNHTDEQWIRDIIDYNQISARDESEYKKVGYVAAGLSDRLDLIKDVITEINQVDPGKSTKGGTPLTNMQKTAVLDIANEKLMEIMSRNGFEYYKAPIDKVTNSFMDVATVPIFDINGSRHIIDFSNGDIQAASSILRAASKGTKDIDSIVTNNLREIASNLAKNGFINEKDISTFDKMYGKNHPYEYAADIAKSINGTISKIRTLSSIESRFSAEKYDEVQASVIRIKNALAEGKNEKAEKIMERSGIDKDLYNALLYKYESGGVYNETNRYIEHDIINTNNGNRDYMQISTIYKNNRDELRSFISELARKTTDNSLTYKDDPYKRTEFSYLLEEGENAKKIYESSGGITLTKGNVGYDGTIYKPGDKITTYRDLFKYLGYDVSQKINGNIGVNGKLEIGGPIDTILKGLEDNGNPEKGWAGKEYAINKQEYRDMGFRYGIVGTENGAYIFGTNAQNEANVYKVITQMTGNESHEWIKNNLGKYAGYYRINKVTNRLVGRGGENVPNRVADLIGRSGNILLSSIDTESGLPMYLPTEYNVFMGSDKRLHGQIRPMTDVVAEAIRRKGMERFVQKVVEGDFSGATAVFKKNQDSVLAEAVMSDSYLTSMRENTVDKSASFNMVDVMKAYELKTSGVETLMKYVVESNDKSIFAPGDKSAKKLRDMFALFNLATDTVTAKGKGTITDFNYMSQINQLTNNSMFKEFYSKSLFTRSVADEPEIINAIMHDNKKRSIAQNILGISFGNAKNENDIRNMLNNYFGKDATIINLVRDAINAGSDDRISDNVKETINRIAYSSKYMRELTTISAASKDVFPFMNIAYMNSVASDSSSIRPTAVSMNRAHTYHDEEISFDNKKYDINFGMSSMSEDLIKQMSYMTVENGFGDRPISISEDGEHYHLNKNVRDWNTQHISMQTPFSNIDQQTAAERLNDKEIIRKVIKSSQSNSTIANATYGNNLDSLLAEYFSDRYKEIAQFNEGKIILASDIYRDKFFSKSEAKKFYSSDFYEFSRQGFKAKADENGIIRMVSGNEDFENTIKIINRILEDPYNRDYMSQKTKIREGDIIGVFGGKDIRFHGIESNFSVKDALNLLNTGKMYVSDDVTAVGDMKINLGQEKNTATGLDIDLLLSRLEKDSDGKYWININGKRAKFSEEQIRATNDMVYDVLSGWAYQIIGKHENKRNEILRPGAVASMDPGKHNLAISLETQWGIITRTYQEALEGLNEQIKEQRVRVANAPATNTAESNKLKNMLNVREKVENSFLEGLHNVEVQTQNYGKYSFGQMLNARIVNTPAGDRVLSYKPEYSARYDYHGMAQGIYETVNAIRENRFGYTKNSKYLPYNINETIINRIANAMKMHGGYVDMYLVNMRQATSDKFVIDARVAEAFKRKAFSDPYNGYGENGNLAFHESGLPLNESIQYKLMKKLKDNIKNDYYIRNHGDLPNNYIYGKNSPTEHDYKLSKITYDLMNKYSNKKIISKKFDDRILNSIRRSIGYYDGFNNKESEYAKIPKGNFITIEGSDIFDKIPRSGAKMEEYQNFIYRLDGEVSEYLKTRAKEENINLVDEIENIVVNVKGFHIDKGGKKGEFIDKIVLPVYNLSSSHDELWMSEGASAVTAFLNAAANYSKSTTKEQLIKTIGYTPGQIMRIYGVKSVDKFNPEMYMAKEYEKLIRALREDVNPRNKKSLANKLAERFEVPNGTEMLAISDTTFGIKPNGELANAANAVNDALTELEVRKFTNPSDPISPGDILDLAKKIKTRKNVFEEYANSLLAIENGAMAGYGGSRGIGHWLIEKGIIGYDPKLYGDLFKVINNKEVMVNMVEAGEAVFKKAGVNFGQVGMQLFEDVSANNGHLAIFDNESRFGGKEFKVNKNQVVAEWKGKMTKAFGDDARMMEIIDSVKANASGSKTINNALEEMRMHVLDVDSLSKEELNTLGINNKSNLLSSDYISALNKNNMMSAERKYALNKLVKANEEAFSGLARRYFTEVGVYGLAERYPVFGSSSTMTTKIYLDRENTLGVGIRYFGPQFPSFLHVDFDADDVFLMFNTNGGLFRKGHDTNKLFREEYEHEALMNAKVLIAYFKDQAKGNVLNNPADAVFWRANRLRKGLVVSNESTAYKEFEKAMNSYIESLPENIKERYKAGDESVMEAVTYAGSLDKRVIDVLNKYDFNVLESITNKLATMKAERTKVNIGFISNAARDVNYTMTTLYEMSNSKAERLKISKIIRSLDVIDFNEDMTSFGNVALLNMAEQAGIDVKKVFDAIELSPTTNIKQGVASLFYASGSNFRGRNAAQNKRRAQFAAMKEIIYSTNPQMFAGEKLYGKNLVEATSLVLDNEYEHIINNADKFAKNIGISEESVKKLASYRHLLDATTMDNAYEVFNNWLIKTEGSQGKDLWKTIKLVMSGFGLDRDYGDSDIGIFMRAATSSPTYDEKLIPMPDQVYFSKPMTHSKSYISSRGYVMDSNGIRRLKSGSLALKMIDVNTYKTDNETGAMLYGDTIAEINEQFRKFFPDSDMDITHNIWSKMKRSEKQELLRNVEKRNVSELIINAILNSPKDYSFEKDIRNLSEGLSQEVGNVFHVGLDVTERYNNGIPYKEYSVNEKYKGIIDRQIGDIQKHLNTVDTIEYLRGNADADNIGGRLVKELNDSIKNKVKDNKWTESDTVIGEFENIISRYRDENNISLEEYNKFFQDSTSDKKAYGIAAKANKKVISAKIDIDKYQEALNKHYRELNDLIGQMRGEYEHNEETIKMFENNINMFKEEAERKQKDLSRQNEKLSSEAFSMLIGGYKKSGQDNYATFLGHEHVYDLKTKQTLKNPNFDRAIIGYGEFSTKTMTRLTKDEFDRLSKELANDKLINKSAMESEAYDAASNLFNAFKSLGLDANLNNENIMNEASKAEQDNMQDAVDELFKKMLNYEVPDEEEVADKVLKNAKDAAKEKAKMRDRTVTGSILNTLKDLKPSKTALKAGAAALAMMFVPAIIGNIAHAASDSNRTGDPITPHSIATEGTNPYTGDPINDDNTPVAEGGRAYSAADTQADNTKQRVEKPKQAPPSTRTPFFERNVYIDRNTGYRFKVSAQTKNRLDKKAMHRSLNAIGINDGRIMNYSYSSQVTDSWLQSKFSEYV